MVRDEKISELVQRALKAVAPESRHVAEEGGFNYNTYMTWRHGTRTPSEANVERLADLLDDRADRIRGLASELRACLRDSEE